MKSLSHVRLFATPWTAAYQAPPSMGFSRQMLGGTYTIASEMQKHTFLFLEALITQTLKAKNKALRTMKIHVCLPLLFKNDKFHGMKKEATDALAEWNLKRVSKWQRPVKKAGISAHSVFKVALTTLDLVIASKPYLLINRNFLTNKTSIYMKYILMKLYIGHCRLCYSDEIKHWLCLHH